MQLPSFTPGIVDSYDPATRKCRVRIPGITDGAEQMPEALLCSSIGDKSEHTEVRILTGDRVWLAFVNGDPRFPIIVGFRPKETGNVVGWRRWHHQNIEHEADAAIVQTAGTTITVTADGAISIEGASITLKAPNITLDGATTITGPLTVQGLLTWLASVIGTGTTVVNGMEIGPTHRHEVSITPPVTGPVIPGF